MAPSGLIPRPPLSVGARLHLPHLRRGHILADNLPAEIHKRLVHIGPASRARFVIRRVAPVLADGEGARSGDGAVFFEIGFVAHDDERNSRVVFDADNLVAEFVEFRQGGEGRYGEDQEEALAGFHVELSGCALD